MHVDGARVRNSFFYRRFSDFVKNDTLLVFVCVLDELGNVPRDGFTFTVGVCCEEYVVCLLRFFLKVGNNLLLPR